MRSIIIFILVVLFSWNCSGQKYTVSLSNDSLSEEDQRYIDSLDKIEVYQRNPNAYTTIREKSIAELSKGQQVFELYIEDTIFFTYWKNDKINFDKKAQDDFLKYFDNSSWIYYMLKDSLPDGYYCLYLLPKKESARKKKERFLVAAGGFKNGIKNGVFIFKDEEKYSRGVNLYKTINFVNGVVHGKVVDTCDGIIRFACDYNYGVRNGFYFIEKERVVTIRFYENGKIVKQTTF